MSPLKTRNFSYGGDFLNRELGPRLLAVAEAIPFCETLVDCGCDHGYVSIYAARCGRAKRITASDINRGPLENAMSEISAAGFEDRIKTVLTDGLCGISHHDCVVIAGMGGETIAEIISRAEWTREKCILVLQPMTKSELLREYLYENGFEIFAERFVKENRHMYCVISARFSGKAEFLPYEKYISHAGLSQPLAKEYADSVAARLCREFRSRVSAGVMNENEKTQRERDLSSLSEVRETL